MLTIFLYFIALGFSCLIFLDSKDIFLKISYVYLHSTPFIFVRGWHQESVKMSWWISLCAENILQGGNPSDEWFDEWPWSYTFSYTNRMHYFEIFDLMIFFFHNYVSEKYWKIATYTIPGWVLRIISITYQRSFPTNTFVVLLPRFIFFGRTRQ